LSNNSKDNFARITSILALLIALATVVMPFVQQSQQFKTQQTEALNVILHPTVNGPIKLTGSDFGDKGVLVEMPWELTISNTGNRKLSIIEKRLSVGESPGISYYSGIDGGLFTSDFQPINLPLTLDSGESRVLLIYVGTLIPKNVFEILRTLNDGRSVTDRDALKALGKKNIDIYGNPVKFRDHGNANFSISFPSANKAPAYWIRLSTGRGNVFFGSATKYLPALEKLL